MVCHVRPALRRRLASALVVVAIAGCGPAAVASPASTPVAPPSAELASSSPADGEAVVLVGRIVTVDEPPVAEALLIDHGEVTAVGTREEVLALAGDQAQILELGSTVAYPGFIDAHAHWIGDREYYDIETPAEAMDGPSPAAGLRSASNGSTPSGSLSSPPSRKGMPCRSGSTPTSP